MDASLVEGLRAVVRGEVILPNDPGYEEARAVWNGMIDRRPAIVARPFGAADVAHCVNFARDNGVPLCIKGGGHNIAGLAVADDALMLDMSRMKGVFVDEARKVVNAQPGCTLGDVDRETQMYGQAAVLGFVSNTGITGLTLGGGFGYLTRRFGWTSDTVKSMNVVTADGNLVRASEQDYPDLFWALRGGGGNFGVVTNIEYELFDVGPEVVAGGVAWSADDAGDVLRFYKELYESAPPEAACVMVARIAPPAPWLPQEIHGKPIIAIFVCHSGSIADGEAFAAPIKSFGSPVGDILQRRSYLSQQCLLDATQPNGRRYYWKSEYLPGVEDGVLETIQFHLAKVPSPHSAILLFPLDGAVQTLPDDHSAVGNRAARCVINVASSWESPDDDEANIQWSRDVWGDIREYSTGGTYINFLTEEEGQDRIKDALGANLDRLVDVKTKFDPDNLFRNNKNIAPRS